MEQGPKSPDDAARGRAARFYDDDARAKLASGQAGSMGTVTPELHVVRLKDALEKAHLDQALTLKATDRVLDLGGGAGRMTLWIAPRVAEVVLVDASEVQIAAARDECARRGLAHVRCIVDSVLAPRPEGPFDVVIVFGVAAHLDDAALEVFVERLATLVVFGGKLVLKEPVTTDGVRREDTRRDASSEIVFQSHFRSRDAYPVSLARHFVREYQAPTCAHLVPAFVGSTEAAVSASRSAPLQKLVEIATPWLVGADPRLRALEAHLRAGPFAGLLAEIPVLQDLYLFRRRAGRAGSENPDLSVVVIGFNEAVCIEPVVWELLDALDSASIDFELVLVDDGSTDATGVRMEALAAADPRIRTSPNGRNLGIGGALRNGFDAAAGHFVTWVPGDGQIGPDTVIELFRRRHEAPMLTTVYRSRDDAWYRHVISQTLNTMISMRTGQVARSGGNYLFARDVWRRHAPRDDDSMMISTAFRNALRTAGETIVEVEIDARARVAGHSKVLNHRTIFRTLAATLKMAGRR